MADIAQDPWTLENHEKRATTCHAVQEAHATVAPDGRQAGRQAGQSIRALLVPFDCR